MRRRSALWLASVLVVIGGCAGEVGSGTNGSGGATTGSSGGSSGTAGANGTGGGSPGAGGAPGLGGMIGACDPGTTTTAWMTPHSGRSRWATSGTSVGSV
jgi:hypothetical protein